MAGIELALVEGVDTFDKATSPAFSSADNGVKTSRNFGTGRFILASAAAGIAGTGGGQSDDGGGDAKKFRAVIDRCRLGTRLMSTL